MYSGAPYPHYRKFFDGSGGNNCAVDHFKEGRGGGPLAVKLGTITRCDLDNMFVMNSKEWLKFHELYELFTCNSNF